jgi:hypothetical protein
MILPISACQYFTYTPRSKSNIRQQKPSIFICERIVDFRMEYQCWPSSKEDLFARGKKYVDAFQGFPYNSTSFKIKDSNTMIFYFSDHKIDRENYNRPQYIDLRTYNDGRDDYNKYNNNQRTDLNAYRGYIKFFKVKDKFAWKIKMQR